MLGMTTRRLGGILAWLCAVGVTGGRSTGQAVEPPGPQGVAPAAPMGSKSGNTTSGKSVLQQYMAALAAGRRADTGGDLVEARQQFERAVALIPDGGSALSELGWVAYRLKDLAAAERATRAAIAHSTKPSVRAGSLYNLGRILTDQGKKTDAAQAFREAWELGRHPATLSALRAVDPTAAAAAWPLVHVLKGPQPLTGKTIDGRMRSACRSQLTAFVNQNPASDAPLTLERLGEADESLGTRILCDQQVMKLPSGGGIEQVLLVSAGFKSNHYVLSTIGMWVQTKEGWFVESLGHGEQWKWWGGTAAFQRTQVVGSYLKVETSASDWESGNGNNVDGAEEDHYSSERYAYILGVGKSGRPSLTSPIQLSASVRKDHGDDASARTASLTCSLELRPTGELLINKSVAERKKVSEKEFPDSALQTPSGSFLLQFP